jgi:hypothetical protein
LGKHFHNCSSLPALALALALVRVETCFRGAHKCDSTRYAALAVSHGAH